MQIIITGGPSVGKTTLVNQLKDKGFSVVDEIATQILQEGITPAPWIDRNAFQEEVLRRQLVSTARTNGNERVYILDRGIFDGAAYYICDGLAVPPVFDTLNVPDYQLVFLLEELPIFEDNGIRFENLEFTRRITPVLEKCYMDRGIPVLRVPCFPPEERLRFVLKKLLFHCFGVYLGSRKAGRRKWFYKGSLRKLPTNFQQPGKMQKIMGFRN